MSWGPMEQASPRYSKSWQASTPNSLGGLGCRRSKSGILTSGTRVRSRKTVHELVMEGMSETKMILDRFNEVSAKFAEEMTDEEMNTLLASRRNCKKKLMLPTLGIWIDMWK